MMPDIFRAKMCKALHMALFTVPGYIGDFASRTASHRVRLA